MVTRSFWNNNHPLTPLGDAMHERFIPAMGATEHVQSEVMRAVLNLHHDYFNNGFGNNMSRPVAFIDKYYLPRASHEFEIAYRDVRETALQPDGMAHDDALTLMLAEVIVALRDADERGELTDIAETIDDMPYVETIFQDEEEDEVEDEVEEID